MGRNIAQDSTIAAPRREPKIDRGTRANLRTPGLLGKRPLIGLTMILLGICLFSITAVNVQTNGPLIPLDSQIVNNFHQVALHSSTFIRDVMILGFYVGEQVIVAIGVMLALYFLYKRFWLELSMVVIAWAGEGAIWLGLSQYFHRTRPTFAVAVWHQMTAPGFPSGHSISAVMCYGLLAYLLVPKLSSRFWKLIVIAAAVLIIVYVGFSRVFVGDHYPTDVLAGYGLGIAWSGFVYTAAELVARRKKNHKTEPANCEP